MVKEILLKIKGQRETFSKVGDYSGNFRRIRVDTRRNPKKTIPIMLVSGWALLDLPILTSFSSLLFQ